MKRRDWWRSLTASDVAAMDWALLLLRTVVGALPAYVHGWHKLVGGVQWLRDGTPWTLVDEIAAMHAPAPVLTAFVATIAQLVCPLCLIVGLLTRLNAMVSTLVPGGAVLQS